MATGRPPVLFVLGFFGLPVMSAGTVMTFLGYMGKIARYMQAETAPVAKDTFNYMAEGTREGVTAVASAVGEGLAAGIGTVGAVRRGRQRRLPASAAANAASWKRPMRSSAAAVGRPCKKTSSVRAATNSTTPTRDSVTIAGTRSERPASLRRRRGVMMFLKDCGAFG